MTEPLKKKLLEAVSSQDLLELLQDHLISLSLEDDELVLWIDRTYALHVLGHSSDYREKLEKAIDKAFGEKTNYQVKMRKHLGSQREKGIQHEVHIESTD